MINFISKFFKPVADFIDDSTLSAEEKLELELKMKTAQNAAADKLLEYDKLLVEAQASILKIETQGNWLQRSWRPLTMVNLNALLTLHLIGLLSNPLPEWFGTLFVTCVGGYILGRSTEKVAPHVVSRLLSKVK